MRNAVCIIAIMFVLAGVAGSGFAAEIKDPSGQKPFYELQDNDATFEDIKDTGCGIVVAMDGSVLIFKGRQKEGFIEVIRSEDGGKTWQEPITVGEFVKIPGEGFDGGRYTKAWRGRSILGSTIVDETTGDIMVFCSGMKTAQVLYRSKDHGKTWKRENIVVKPDVNNWMTSTMGSSETGITLRHGKKKGRLLIPTRVFWEYANKSQNSKYYDKHYSNALYSDDGGKTWIPSAPFPLSGTGEAALVELRDGRIYYNSRTHNRPGNRRIAFSHNGGETWVNEHEDDELFDGPPDVYGCKAGLARLDYDDRDILVFSRPRPHETPRRDVTVWASFDGGQTWPTSRLVHTKGSYTWMAVGRKGTPSEGMIYVLSIWDWFARFNLAWVMENRSETGKPPPVEVEPPVEADPSVEAEPFFEVWDEPIGYGVLDVAMDGTVLLFSTPDVTQFDHQEKDHVYLKSSQDGGATWSENRVIGKPLELDCKALGIGPYDGRRGWEKNWGFAQLGTSVVDENTGEIMFFMTALHPASKMYKSRDHGKTWKLEDIEIKKDPKGFLPAPNAACDPGVTVKHGPHKGRLLVPAFVWPHYDRHHDSEIYTTSLYSDDHGKTWTPGGAFTVGGTGEPSLAELNDGTIYFNSRNNTLTGNRWIAYSDDSGETLRDIHEDDELFDGPPDAYGCKAALLKLDRGDRDILLFSSPSPKVNGRRNIRVWVSFDGGKTWPHNRLIKRGPGNYTWMTEGRKGTPSEGFIYLLAGKDWMARFNMAWLFTPEEPEVVLSKRAKYRFSDPDVYKSSEDAELFTSSEPRLKNSPKGYGLKSGVEKGHVLTQKIVLSSGEMKVSCNAPNGKLMVLVMDEGYTVLRDSHAITGPYEIDKAIPWQDGPIDKWVGKEVYLKFLLEGDAQVFDISFGGIPATAGNTAAIGPDSDKIVLPPSIVLPPRNDYVMDQKPPFVRSAQNAKPFSIKDDRLKRITAGYRLSDAKDKGHVLSHKISLPGDEMKISCDVSSGSITVSLFDADGNLLKTSKPVTGGLKVREPVQWPDGFTLNEYVSVPIAVKFDLKGDARLYAIRFDELFWD